MNISTIMILAAGLGKRLRPYTSKTPKTLIKIGKYTLIEKIINEIEKNRFKKIIINLHYPKIQANLQASIPYRELLIHPVNQHRSLGMMDHHLHKK